MAAEIGQSVDKARSHLESGGLVAIPTETVYGLAANAFDTTAVASVFKAKNRPSFDPLIVHIPHTDYLSQIAEPTDVLTRVSKQVWPGPLTILLKKKSVIAPIVTAGSELVAVRIPNHPLTLKLLQSLEFPLVAPSANPFGYVSPTSARHVADQLGNELDYILDGGDCEIGLESTIISYLEGQLTIHRLGGLSQERIEELSGEKAILKLQQNSNPVSPGTLDKHYSPSTQLILVDQLTQLPQVKDSVLISFGDQPVAPAARVLNLSTESRLEEAAANLFRFLRELDNLPYQRAYIKLVPDQGLGRAINDRIRRACTR